MARARANIQPTNFKKGWWKGTPNHPRWRVTPEGVVHENAAGPVRTRWGKAQGYAEKVWNEHGEAILTLGEIWDLDPRIIVATAAAESAGNASAERYEAHIGDTSYGLCQLLTAVAYQVGRRSGWPSAIALKDHPNAKVFGLPARPIAMGGSAPLAEWKAFLGNPWNNLAMCAALHSINNERLGCRHDPVLLYTAYNSGGLYVGRNTYGMHATKSAVEAFVLFFNDISAIILE